MRFFRATPFLISTVDICGFGSGCRAEILHHVYTLAASVRKLSNRLTTAVPAQGWTPRPHTRSHKRHTETGIHIATGSHRGPCINAPSWTDVQSEYTDQARQEANMRCVSTIGNRELELVGDVASHRTERISDSRHEPGSKSARFIMH